MPKNQIIFFTSLFLLFFTIVRGQSYRWAAGIKVSKQMGLSVVYSPQTPYSIEGVISKNLWTNESGVSLIGRYHHKILFRSLNFYGGGGLHYGMYEDTERLPYTGLVLNGGAEISLGKTNLAFNISPLLGVGNEEVKFRIGSDVTVRRVLEKQPRRNRNGLFQKIGIGQKDGKKGKSKSKKKKNKNKKKKKKKKNKNKKRKGIFRN